MQVSVYADDSSVIRRFFFVVGQIGGRILVVHRRRRVHLVQVVHGNYVEHAAQLPHVDGLRPDLAVVVIEVPHVQVVVAASDELVRRRVEELDRGGVVVVRRGPTHRLTLLHVPHDQRVVIHASEGREVAVVAGEAQGLDLHLVQAQTVNHLAVGKVPEDHVGGEAHVRDLARRQEV